jgi:hypothetical protein
MPDKGVTVTADGQPLRRPDGRGVDFSADGIGPVLADRDDLGAQRPVGEHLGDHRGRRPAGQGVRADGQPLRRPDGRGVDFSADGIALSPDGRTLYWQAIKTRRAEPLSRSTTTKAPSAPESVR